MKEEETKEGSAEEGEKEDNYLPISVERAKVLAEERKQKFLKKKIADINSVLRNGYEPGKEVKFCIGSLETDCEFIDTIKKLYEGTGWEVRMDDAKLKSLVFTEKRK